MGKIFEALEKSKETNMGASFSAADVEESSVVNDLPMGETHAHEKSEPGKSESGKNGHNGEYQDEPEIYEKHQPHEIPQNLDQSLITHIKPHSFEAEQFRILKTAILFPQSGIPPRTIMVTSTAPEEGKSFVASNIAISIAQSIDEYVLLMDCDLRIPSLHTRFGFSNVPGLSDYLTLTEKKSLGSIIYKTAIDKLSLLPAGNTPANPSELISSEEMRRLIQEVKSRYLDRYIIIDSPPPYLTAEANALARQVDGIVIVVKTGKTRRSHVQDLIDTYGRKKILGVVKNFSDLKHGFKKYEYR